MIVSGSDPDSLDRAAAFLQEGRSVVIPTDTVYGIAAIADDPRGVQEIFRLKRREHSKALAVLVSDLEMASSWGDLQEASAEVAAGWPGALTVVVPRRPSRLDVWLGGDASTIGLRIPDHRFTLDLIARVGPLAATSANVSGDPTLQTAEAIAASMPDIEIVVDGGRLGSSASRVVSFIGARRDLR